MIEYIARWVLLSAMALAIVLLKFALNNRGRRLSGKSTLPLPPGPPPLPVIGNLLDVPMNNMEVEYHDLSRKYGTFHEATSIYPAHNTSIVGDVVYLNACGQPIIVLGTHEAATELLEKRSSNTSDRLFSTMAEL